MPRKIYENILINQRSTKDKFLKIKLLINCSTFITYLINQMSDQRLILIDGSVENRTQLGRGGRVHIVRIGEGASADEQSSGHIWFDPTSRSPIKDLIEAAEMSEWTALLKTSQFERASPTIATPS